MIILILIIGFFVGRSGCNDNSKLETKNDKKEIVNNDTTKVKNKEDNKEGPIAETLKYDITKIKEALVKISIYVDKNNINPNRTFQQFSQILTAYSSFSSSKYNVYKSAKNAKAAAEIAHDNIYTYDFPDILPESTKDSLRTALEYISTCYSNMSSAFDIAMDMANDKSDMSAIDEYNEKISNAPELFLAGLAEIFKIQKGYGMTQKEINKIRRKLKNQ